MSQTASDSLFVFSPASAPAARGAGGGMDAWVHETRREISEIVREVAAAARQPQPTSRFLNFLADRTLRAMAAEGIVIWRRTTTTESEQTNSPNDWQGVVRLGQFTDQSLDANAIAIHQHLIVAVGSESQPVVVPPTPGAMISEVPTNPCPYPVAMVPIERDDRGELPEYLIEVFLEPEGGVATQRGYLRFIAQMADLAGEFLRGDEARRLRHRDTVHRQLDQITTHCYAAASSREVMTRLVDSLAELFALDRVALCTVQNGRAEILAVSYVATISQHSSAADQIREAALSGPDAGESKSAEEMNVVAVVRVTESRLASEPSGVCLVCLSSDTEAVVDDELPIHLRRSLTHASQAWTHLRRLELIPGVSRLSRLLLPSFGSVSTLGSGKRIVAAILGTVMLSVVAFLPVPYTIATTGTLIPGELENFCAPRSTIVEQIHVEHGDHVEAGQVLVTLRDDDLNQQITTLAGRRAVLMEQQTRWTQALIDTSSHRLDRTGQMQTERDLVQEELRGIDQQLEQLRSIQAGLVLRATTPGTVDAWQIRQRLGGRPLRRGEFVLSVIGDGTEWMVDATIPQTRLVKLEQARRDSTLGLEAVLQSDPARSWMGTLETIGPVQATDPQGPSRNLLLVRLDTETHQAGMRDENQGPLNGAPVHLRCRCGHVPLVMLLVQDIVAQAKTNYRMYWGDASVPGGET